MPDVGVDRVREVHRGGIARQRLHFPARGEDVDFLRVELDLEVLQKLLRIADLLLPLEQLTQPDEVLLVASRANPSFLVFPVRRDAVLGGAMHIGGPDLHFEGHAPLADHRGVQRLITVGSRHRDEVLDPPRHR